MKDMREKDSDTLRMCGYPDSAGRNASRGLLLRHGSSSVKSYVAFSVTSRTRRAQPPNLEKCKCFFIEPCSDRNRETVGGMEMLFMRL